ncbi:MAG: hypothetical protein ACK56I_28760, partial [bacterium]
MSPLGSVLPSPAPAGAFFWLGDLGPLALQHPMVEALGQAGPQMGSKPSPQGVQVVGGQARGREGGAVG